MGKPSTDTTDAQQGGLTLAGRRYLSPAELSRLLGVTPRTLNRWHEARIGPPRVKVGSMVLYDCEKLPEWLDCHECRPVERRTDRRRAR
ncbi:helix-turn-helix domain-containing protein [uncultured Albimonas sp.]|mgnify:CR=1 FL=1|uniref:helix-turn-helix domain-containing protein n=1 Tax=uncultured Albimonas sp. TaxID=1331701 RepID=UPI0030EF2943|tara:strand:+ start:406 stop:672 length:267 start_codon:yes stop_codon:yes gene_type:complete